MEVALDGEPVAVREDSDYDERPLSSLERVEIGTGDLRVVIVEAVGAFPSVLHGIEEKLQEAATKLRIGREQEGHSRLCEGLEQLEWVQVNLRACETFLGVEMASLAVAGTDGRGLLSQLRQKLGEIRQKMEEEDLLDLADTIEYELVATVARFQDLVPQIIRKLQSRTH